MKFLTYEDLREKGIKYSKVHLWRLEKRDLFRVVYPSAAAATATDGPRPRSTTILRTGRCQSRRGMPRDGRPRRRRGKPGKGIAGSSRAEIEERRAALFDIVAAMRPMIVRQVFYQATVRGLVDKSELEVVLSGAAGQASHPLAILLRACQ